MTTGLTVLRAFASRHVSAADIARRDEADRTSANSFGIDLLFKPLNDQAWTRSAEQVALSEALCELFFSRLAVKESLVFFYTKSGHPLDESIGRLIVGVGQIEWITALQFYEASKGPRYPLWDRLFTHSIRPDGHEGLLVPYHDYLEPTGDPDEDDRRRDLLEEIVVVPERGHIKAFTHVGEHGTHDVALSSLVRCLETVRKIREHGDEPLGPELGEIVAERAKLIAIGM